MARTLSTNVTNGKAGDSIPVYLLEIDYGPIASLSTLRYSTLATGDFPTAWSGTAHTANNLKRNGIGDITDKCDVQRGGNVADVGGFTVTLGNGNLVSDTWDTYQYYNRRIELRLIFADQTAPTWANAVPLFYGFIDRVGPWDYDGLKISAKGSWRNRHREICNKILESVEFADIPENNEGKFKPVIYGDWTAEKRHKTAIGYYFDGGSNDGNFKSYFRGYCVKNPTNVSADDGEFLFASHRLHTFTGGQLSNLVSYHKDIEAWTQTNIAEGDEKILLANGDYIRDGVDNHAANKVATIHIVPTLVSETGTTTGANCLHQIQGAGYYITALSAGQSAKYRVTAESLNGIKNSGTTLATANVIGKITYQGSLVNDYIQVIMTKTGDAASPVSATNTASSTSQTLCSSTTLDFTTSDWEYIDIEVKAWALTGDDGGYWKLEALYVAFTPVSIGEELDELYSSGKGRPFDSFIDVANHSNSLSAGDMIENPAYMVESILCQECGLTPAGLSKAVEFGIAASFLSMTVKHSELLALTGDFTLIAWVYPDAFAVVQGLIRKAASDGATVPANFDWYLETGSGLPKLSLGNGSSATVTSATNPPASSGAWVHLAVKVSGTTVTHYRNGSTNGSATNSATRADGGGSLIFGRAAASGSPYLDGRLDEVKIYNRALSDAEVLADYNSGSGLYGKTGEDGLVGLWHFDEGDGWVAHDSSGNDNHASTESTYDTWNTGKVVSTQQISESAFDTVGATRTSWKFARQLLDPINSREAIREICYEGGFAYHTRPDGLEALAILTPTGSPTALTTADVLMNGKKSSMRVWRGDVGNVRNEFVLHYRKNMATGEFEKTLFVKNPQSAEYDSKFTNLTSSGDTYWQKCSDAYADFQQVNTWEYNAEWIRDDATAELFIKWMIDWLTRMPLFCSFDTTIKNIGLSLFDQKLINHPLIPAAENATNHFLLIEQKISPSTDTMSLTFMDIGTP